MELYNEIYAYESDKVKPFIYKTNDLGKFNNYEFNRDLDLGHVKMLASRIKDFTLCPLICTKELDKIFILDGQHRLEVAKQLNIPIYYRLVENVNSLEIAELQTKKNWNHLNWAKYWNFHKIPDYERLIELHINYGITICTLGGLLISDKISRSRHGINASAGPSIISGKFSITNEKFALKILNQLQDYPDAINKSTKFIKALVMANTAYNAGYSEYKHDIMKKRIAQYPERIEKKANANDYLRMIEIVYNIGLADDKKIRLF